MRIPDDIKRLLIVMGGNIRRLRDNGNKTQEELAKAVGVSRDTIRRIEQGENSELATILKIAKALKVNPADFFLSNSDRSDITYKTKLLLDKISEALK